MPQTPELGTQKPLAPQSLSTWQFPRTHQFRFQTAELPSGAEQRQTAPAPQSSSVKHSSAVQVPCRQKPGSPASNVHCASLVHGVPVPS
jgi:hypothetical protein